MFDSTWEIQKSYFGMAVKSGKLILGPALHRSKWTLSPSTQVLKLFWNLNVRYPPRHQKPYCLRDGATNYGAQTARYILRYASASPANSLSELQNQYTNYKNGLQQIAQKIGDVETEAEEHKWVPGFIHSHGNPSSSDFGVSNIRRHISKLKISPLESLMLTAPVPIDLFLKRSNLFLVTASAFEW